MACLTVRLTMTAWHKGVRRIWELSYRTHSRLLSTICGFLPVKDQLICRSASFIVKCLAIGNDVIYFVTTYEERYRPILEEFVSCWHEMLNILWFITE